MDREQLQKRVAAPPHRARVAWTVHARSARLGVQLLLLLLLWGSLGGLTSARVATYSARVVSVAQFVPPPVVEIVFPPDGHVHADAEISIQVLLRRELLGDTDPTHVCVGMTTVAVPEEVFFDDAAGGPTERCHEVLDDRAPTASYTVTGLLAGARYSVSAALVHGDRVVGLSRRAFDVASIPAVTDAHARVRLSIPEALRMARTFHVADNRAAAAVLYTHVLALFPDLAEALHGLGQVRFQDGQTHQAVELIDRALRVEPDDATAHVSLALCFKTLGHTEDAIAAFRRALELRPSYVHAALGLGALLQALSKWDEALHEYRKVVSTVNEPPPVRQLLEPPHERMVVEALGWVCEILRLTDGLYDAERCLTQATQRFPTEVRFHIDRGHLLLYGGQFESAQRAYETASQLGSVHAMTHAADVLEAMGEYAGSIRRYQEVLQSPDAPSSTVHNQISIMMTTVLPRILPSTQAAIDQERERFQSNVASVIRQMESDMNPIFIDPSRIAFSTGVTMNSHNRNNRELKALLGMMYHGLWIQVGVVREEYVNSYGVTSIPYHQKYTHDPPFPHARLRVGFVSRFFYNSAVGLYLNELFAQLNASKYEVFVFGIGLSKSVKSYDQVPQIAEHVVALPRDLRLARDEIRAHEMDILVYPELGMDKTTYFLAYHRLAPVQAAWWGNPDTTGVPTIDYYITSEHEHKGFRDHYTETVYQMKGMGIYHTLPPLPNSTVTREDIRRTVQGRFNLASDFHFYLSIESILHLHPDFDEAIRLILVRDPLAHIFLVSSSNRKSWRSQLHTRIEAHIGPNYAGRILFFTDVDLRQEILLLGAADAVLGSVHLTRTKAAMQAFSAGVPVVTLAGTLWATRITAAFYKQMGIRGLTVSTLDDYADVAVRLATDESFRDRMVRKIRRHRDRLSRDRTAVSEWEKFFDFASTRLRALGDNSTQAQDDGPTDDEVLAAERNQEAERRRVATPAGDAMTCPATSLLHLL